MLGHPGPNWTTDRAYTTGDWICASETGGAQGGYIRKQRAAKAVGQPLPDLNGALATAVSGVRADHTLRDVASQNQVQLILAREPPQVPR